MTRSGARIESRIVDLCLKLGFYADETNDIVFYWQNKASIKAFDYYRVLESNLEKRSAEDIPTLEYVNAILDILDQAMSLFEVDLIKETAKCLGYQRMGVALDTAIKDSIKYATKRGIIKKKDNGSYVVCHNV